MSVTLFCGLSPFPPPLSPLRILSQPPPSPAHSQCCWSCAHTNLKRKGCQWERKIPFSLLQSSSHPLVSPLPCLVGKVGWLVKEPWGLRGFSLNTSNPRLEGRFEAETHAFLCLSPSEFSRRCLPQLHFSIRHWALERELHAVMGSTVTSNHSKFLASFS